MNKKEEYSAKSVPEERSSQARADGYMNVLTKYGTKQDSSTSFSFVPENYADDYTLSINYQFNGLFAKIIDLPAGEAISKGFKLNIKSEETENTILDKCEELGVEEKIEEAVKWSRLYGGAVIVMLINDGRGIDEPLNYRAIRGIDELMVYESAIVDPLYSSTYYKGTPEYFQISSIDGTFTVHSTRCLVFKNGKLPQLAIDYKRHCFGFSEYDRIKTALRETVTSHGYAPRMLERAIQSVFSIKDLSNLLSTSQGEDVVVKRLQLIDMARSMFNSIAIDADGESFDFKTAPYSGVKEILDSTCNMLSAVTNIPQTLLFGSSPAGMNATGESDFEGYYAYIKQIQSRMIKSQLKCLLDIIIQSLLKVGKIEEYPTYKLEFNPLWSMSDAEKAQVELMNQQIKQAKASTAQIYVGMQALDPSEIRVGLSKSDEYDVETLLDNVSDEDLFSSIIDESSDEMPNNAETNRLEDVQMQEGISDIPERNDSLNEPTAAAVIVMNKDGKILCGLRNDNKLVCGPGGHIENGEAPIQTAIRETQEEFNITPNSLIPLCEIGENNALQHKTSVYLCTSYNGNPQCDEKEITLASFISLDELLENKDKMFKPFLKSIEIIKKIKFSSNNKDGGSGSGNFGHEGVPGQVGGSAPNASSLNDRLKNAINGNSKDEFNKTVKDTLRDIPVGTKFEQFGVVYTKSEDDKFVSSEGYELSTDETASLCFSYLGGPHYLPQFHDVEVEDIASEKIKSGELKPDETQVVNSASAIAEYQNYGYSAVNTALRKGEKLTGKAKEIDDGLQKAFEEENPISHSKTVMRDSGMSITSEVFQKTGLDKYLQKKFPDEKSLEVVWMDRSAREEIKSKLIGYKFEEKGYSSTTTSKDSLEEFSKGKGSENMISPFGAKETMTITIPKGSKVLDLGKDGFISGSGENEVILNKNASYEIYEVDYDYSLGSLMLYCNYSDSRSDGAKNTIDNKNSSDIIKLSKNIDEDIPKDKVEFYTAENGKTYAVNSETHETSGLGPDIDKKSEKEQSIENKTKKSSEHSQNEAEKLSFPKVYNFKTENGVMTIPIDLKIKASKSGKVMAHIKPGSKITNIFSFAGEGSDTNLVMSGTLAKSHPGTKPQEWSHKAGDSEVIIDDIPYEAEIHWFEHPKAGQVSFKLKERKKRK